MAIKIGHGGKPEAATAASGPASVRRDPHQRPGVAERHSRGGQGRHATGLSVEFLALQRAANHAGPAFGKSPGPGGRRRFGESQSRIRAGPRRAQGQEKEGARLMAVTTITAAKLAVQMRIIADEGDNLPAGQQAVLTRQLAAAEAMVNKLYNSDSAVDPDLFDEAVIRAASYLHDSDPARRRGNVLVNSGAAYLLDQVRGRKVQAVEEDEEE